MFVRRIAIVAIAAIIVWHSRPNTTFADNAAKEGSRPKRILLLGQRRDNHPKTTHEYMAGIRLIAKRLQTQKSVQVVVVQADGPWPEGPELLDATDGVVLYLSEGAKWISDDPLRLAAFRRLAQRGGGLTCLHWGMGTREAAAVPVFVSLFGGCHGGPDRKYQVGDYHVVPAANHHPILSGVIPFDVHDEFYYALKFTTAREGFTNLLQARVDKMDYPVSWAWERPDLGRSFGFSGLHFHENWQRIEYRRIVIQGIVWTLQEQIPKEGLTVDVMDNDFALPEDAETK